jgi:hypothetical protein
MASSTNNNANKAGHASFPWEIVLALVLGLGVMGGLRFGRRWWRQWQAWYSRYQLRQRVAHYRKQQKETFHTSSGDNNTEKESRITVSGLYIYPGM